MMETNMYLTEYGRSKRNNKSNIMTEFVTVSYIQRNRITEFVNLTEYMEKNVIINHMDLA